MTVTTTSESEQSSPDTDGDGDAETDAVGLTAGLVSVGNGEGLVVLAVGAAEPPGEISHQTRANTTKTPRITMMRRRQ